MTVSTTTSRAAYSTNGTTGPFTVPFYFLADEHLLVTYVAGGVSTTLVLTTDYTVTGAGDPNGGAITLVSSLPAGGTITIVRDVPATQLTDYVNLDAFPAESHERALDKLTMIAQQQDEVLNRALVFPVGDETDGLLPSAADRANTLQGYDALGRPAIYEISLAASQSFSHSDSNPAGTVGGRLAQTISVKDAPFNAVGDGVTDDTAAIQLAVDRAALIVGTASLDAPGVQVEFPAGVYLVTSPITVTRGGIGFVGQAGRGAQIKSAGNVFNVGDYTNTLFLFHVEFRNLNLFCTSKAATAPAIKQYRSAECKYTDMVFVDWNCDVECTRAFEVWFTRNKSYRSGRTAQAESFIKLIGTDESAFASPNSYTPGGGAHISHCEFAGASANGLYDTQSVILLKSCDGLYMDNCHATGYVYGLDVFPDGTPTSRVVVDINLSQVYWDQPSAVAAAPRCVYLRGTVRETITLASGTARSLYENIRLTTVYMRGAAEVDRCMLVDVTDGDTWQTAGNRRLEKIQVTGGEVSGATICGIQFIGATGSRVEARGAQVSKVNFRGNASASPAGFGTAITAECESISIVSNTVGPDSGTSDYIISAVISDAGASDSSNPSSIVALNNLSEANGNTGDAINVSNQTGCNTLTTMNLVAGVGRLFEQQYKKTTTDATPANIWSHVVPTNTSGFVDVVLTAADATGARYVVYSWTAAFKRDGGATVLDGGAVTAGRAFKDGTTPAPTFALSTNTLNVGITGVAATTINWGADIRLFLSR